VVLTLQTVDIIYILKDEHVFNAVVKLFKFERTSSIRSYILPILALLVLEDVYPSQR